jgi:hypothetical protein
MKALNLLATRQISGGEQFLVITSVVDIENIPSSCIERFFNSTISTNALVGLTEENLIPALTNRCTDYVKPNFSWNTEADLTLIDLKVI